MKRVIFIWLITASIFFVSCKYSENDNPASLIPSGDYHTHLRSQDGTNQFCKILEYFGNPLTQEDSLLWTSDLLINDLDLANIDKATVLSVAYIFSYPEVPVPDEVQKVQSENDWIGQEVDKYKSRLIGFGGVNPLKDYALDEIKRWDSVPGISGLKLHFTNSDVDLLNPVHIDKLKSVFMTANTSGLPIVVHMRKRELDYGYQDVMNFIDEVLPSAPDVLIQIAHMGGWGGYDPQTDDAMIAFIQARNSGKLGENIYFDISFVVPIQGNKWEMGENNMTQEESEEWQLVAGDKFAERIHQFGIEKFFYGTDYRLQQSGEGIEALKTRKPLADDDLALILENIPPYFK